MGNVAEAAAKLQVAVLPLDDCGDWDIINYEVGDEELRVSQKVAEELQKV